MAGYHTSEFYCSLGMHFLLLEKSKNVAHIKMWTSLWDRLNWGGRWHPYKCNVLSEVLKSRVIASFLTLSQYSTAILPQKCLLLQPEGPDSSPFPLWFLFFFFRLSTMVTNQENSFTKLATIVYWELGGGSQFPSISDFRGENRSFMSFLSLSSVHTHRHSHTLTRCQKTCCL